MTREESLNAAWRKWHERIAPVLIPFEPSMAFRAGFNAGWDAREKSDQQAQRDAQ
jgi:hypothetical protein